MHSSLSLSLFLSASSSCSLRPSRCSQFRSFLSAKPSQNPLMKAFTTRPPINTHVTPEKLCRALIRARQPPCCDLSPTTAIISSVWTDLIFNQTSGNRICFALREIGSRQAQQSALESDEIKLINTERNEKYLVHEKFQGGMASVEELQFYRDNGNSIEASRIRMKNMNKALGRATVTQRSYCPPA